MCSPDDGQRLKAYEQTMLVASYRDIDSWPVGEPFALIPSMQSLTLDVIMRTIFGVYEEDRRAELKRRIRAAIDPMSERSGIVLLVLSGGRFGDRGAVQRFEQRKQAM